MQNLSFFLVILFSSCIQSDDASKQIANSRCSFYSCDFQVSFLATCHSTDTVNLFVSDNRKLQVWLNTADWSGEYFEIDSAGKPISLGEFTSLDSTFTIEGEIEDIETGNRLKETLTVRVIGNCN